MNYKNILLIGIIAITSIFSHIAEAQTLYPNKFKDFFSDVVIVSDKSISRRIAELPEGETIKLYSACDELYRFVSKQADSLVYEILAFKKGDYFECKKSKGKKVLFYKRFYFGNGCLVEDGSYPMLSLEVPDMNAEEFLMKGFGYVHAP